MKNAEQVLVRPVVSEKSYALMEDGVYVFVVAPNACSTAWRTSILVASG